MRDKRPVRVILSGQAKEAFEELNRVVESQLSKGISNSEEIQLLKSIKEKSERIKADPTCGDNIPHRLIPKTLEVSNLFRIGLTGYWRMLYTLDGNRVEVVAFILYLVDHPTYDKLFGYKKR
ncbi:MAG: hypothetical protein V1827_04785 [Candidatus Micrarchaeota archaeon]